MSDARLSKGRGLAHAGHLTSSPGLGLGAVSEERSRSDPGVASQLQALQVPR